MREHFGDDLAMLIALLICVAVFILVFLLCQKFVEWLWAHMKEPRVFLFVSLLMTLATVVYISRR